MRHWVNFLDLPVNGIRFNSSVRYLKGMNVKDELRLVREQQNEYDKNAVAVFHEDEKIGYVPASSARSIASLMDAGFPLRARVSLVEPMNMITSMVISINDRQD